jgi:hypothetical protein
MRALLIVLACLGIPQDRPYADPSQLDVPWPKHSHIKQPWRGFLETRSAHDFLRGIGVNYNVPGNDETVVRLLAETGFRAFRREIGWGSVKWDESGLNDEARLRKFAALCRTHGIRLTMLLNAHQGVPCPVKFFNKRLAEDAPKDARTVKFTDTRDITPGRTGISGLTDYWAAEALVTRVNEATGECELSKPLPKEMKKDKDVPMATLKYLPLHPVGTPEFDETSQGWVRYAQLICRALKESGVEDFDLEIWNELTFGTQFLNANNYHNPKPFKFPKDFLNEGGQCWELARRTVEAIRREHPKVRFIWGFSNTTFFHTAVDKLPPGIDGQSYHPYGTGTRKLPEQEYHKGKPELNLDGFTPTTQIRCPEGWAHTFIQTESLMRHLNPEARKRCPPGVSRFSHYMTEHGVLPEECGIHDEAGAWQLKTKCALRSFCLWMNKGVEVLHYFCAHEDKALGFGLLPPGAAKLPADAEFGKVATPPMRALRNFTRAFEGSAPLKEIRPVDVSVTPAGAPKEVFKGLTHADLFAFLPWQVNEGKVAAAVYVMTLDATAPFEEERYRLAIGGFPAKIARLYDPVADKAIPVTAAPKGNGIEVTVPVTDTPRVLLLEK